MQAFARNQINDYCSFLIDPKSADPFPMINGQ